MVSAKDKTVIITKGKDAKTVKVGPTVVINKETYKVVGIGKKAFANCSKLNKVIIKGKALKNKGIGKQAFSKTAKKATVKWPKGLKSKDKNKLKKAIKKAGLKVK